VVTIHQLFTIHDSLFTVFCWLEGNPQWPFRSRNWTCFHRWVTFKSHSLWQFLTMKNCTGKRHRSPILSALAQSSYTRWRTSQN